MTGRLIPAQDAVIGLPSGLARRYITAPGREHHMQLTLEVISENGQAMGAGRRKTFGPAGGRIGRAADCEWVLPSPDKYVHRHHATVLFANGAFFVRPEGENGIAVGDPQAIIATGRLSPLHHGDRLYIDHYEILATIAAERAEPAHEGPFGRAVDWTRAPLIEPANGKILDPLAGLPPVVDESAKRERPFAGLPQGTVLEEPFVPPPLTDPPGRTGARQQPMIPVDPRQWNKTQYAKTEAASSAEVGAASRAAPESGFASISSADTGDTVRMSVAFRGGRGAGPTDASGAGAAAALDMEAMLRGAGVDPENLAPEAAATLGQIFKVIVQGTIDALRAREEIKTEFRLTLTRVKSAENNPLTFAVDAADALNSLLSRRNPAFLPPLEAFRRAFGDIRDHQVAMLVGMRAGFEAVVKRFDPETLQDTFDKQTKRSGLLGSIAKPNYWGLYQDYYSALEGDRDNAFRKLFGDEFALAYERQSEFLKRSRTTDVKTPAT